MSTPARSSPSSPPPRVLMLGWEFPPRVTGGLGTACAGIARGLLAAGVELSLALPQPERREDAPAAGAAPGLEVTPVAAGLAPYAAVGGAYSGDLFGEVERFAAHVERIAAARPFDVVHAHDWMTFAGGVAAAAARGAPLVVHVHSLEEDRNPGAPDPAIRAAEGRGLAAARRIVCVSRYTAERVARLHGVDPARIRVVHNAVDLCPAPGLPAAEREPLVVFLGRVTRQKAPERFVEAAARVAALEPRARFVLAGDGDLLPAVRARVAELGLAERFELPGFLAPPARDALLARASAFVLTSVSEPFGIAPLEALAAGAPVVLSRASGVSEVLRSCLLVDSWDVDGTAEAILALLRHPALRRQLVEDGRRELTALRWEARGEQLLGLYRELCAAPPPPDSRLAPLSDAAG